VLPSSTIIRKVIEILNDKKYMGILRNELVEIENHLIKNKKEVLKTSLI
jgi:hypothetical protein